MRHLKISSKYSEEVQFILVGLNEDDIMCLTNHDLLMTICLPRPHALINSNTHVLKTQNFYNVLKNIPL